MSKPKKDQNQDGQLKHYSVGALIKRNNKYLLIDRINFPFGFAGLAGHIDEGENKIQALKREIKEESGLKINSYKLLFEEELNWNSCSKGVPIHYWYLFKCNVSGKIKQNYIETKSIKWYTVDEIKKLNLEKVWEYWFKKLKII